MDKTWTSISNRLSLEFRHGLSEFINKCKPIANVGKGSLKCPCRRCLNMEYQTLKVVETHILRFGFDATYDNWIHHGEEHQAGSSSESSSSHAPSPSRDDFERMNDMANVMADLDQNGDNGSESTHEDHEQYENVYEAMNTKLYEGISSFSSMDFLVKLMNMKVDNKWTNRSFDELLKLLKLTFPSIKLVDSHYEAKKLLASLGLGYENIHVCKYDCAIFYKEHAHRETCPICGESRWRQDRGNGSRGKIPHKVMRYFPIIPRLKRLFAMEETAKLMRWHSNENRTSADVMTHPRDGKAWRAFDVRHPHFSKEHRSVRLGLAADGVNPFGDMSQSYSMWPVILTVYNLPPWLIMKSEYLILTLLIPGPKSPGKDFDIFLRPVVDELKSLWLTGVDIIDAATENRGLFRMRAALMWTINDFPARSSLSGWSGQGYMACPTCNEHTPSMRVLGKVVYFGTRMFLPIHHRWRSSRDFDGLPESRSPPEKKTMAEILNQLNRVRPKVPGKHKSHGGAKTHKYEDELNWKKKSIFFELPYWLSNDLKHNIDMMHLEKNVCDSIVGTILDDPIKSKDTLNARRDLKTLGIRPELHLYEDKGKIMKPRARYTLPPSGRLDFCDWIRSVRFPDGFASNLRRCVPQGQSRLTGLKSHDCHIIMQRLLPVAARAYLDSDISDAIIELCNFFKKMSAKSLSVSDLVSAESDVILILCKLEKIFPLAFFDIMVHLVIHLPEEAILGGPEHLRWMYPIESFLKELKGFVRNPAKPEGSIAEAYVAKEAMTYCARYFTDVETKFNRPRRNPISEVTSQLSVFRSQCIPIGANNSIAISTEATKLAQFYILNNCPEIDSYLEEHKQKLMALGVNKLESQHKHDFGDWFYKKVYSNRRSVPKEVYALACGCEKFVQSYSGCVVNGVRFLTHARDIRRKTQNSGVSVPGVGGEMYYGILQEILEFHYTNKLSVVLFRCKWFKSDNRHVMHDRNITTIDTSVEGYKDDQYILATQARQVFYTDDPSRSKKWQVVHDVHHVVEAGSSTDLLSEVDLLHPSNSSHSSLFVDLGNIEHIEIHNGNTPPYQVDETISSFLGESDDDDIEDDTVAEYEDDRSSSGDRTNDSNSD